MKKQQKHLINLVNQLEAVIAAPLYDNQWNKKGHWDYIAFSISPFLKYVNKAHRILGQKKNLKFVDIGCGLGVKVHLASRLFDAYGIELNANYAKVAKKITTPKEFARYGWYKNTNKSNHIFQEDALEHHYGDYDVIYYFRPMCNNKMERQLEQRVWQQAKQGAVVIPIYAITNVPRNFKKVGNEMYQRK